MIIFIVIIKITRYFVKGLRDFVPDELLAMFDENELEVILFNG